MHRKESPYSINSIYFEKQPPGPSPKMGCIENRSGLPTEWVSSEIASGQRLSKG